MTFGEKLAKLTSGRNRADLSRQAGLPPNAISDYVNKNYLPRLDTARALAAVLNVSIDWLADDAMGWPAPPVGKAASTLTTEELVAELGTRASGPARAMLAKIIRAEKIDWVSVANELVNFDLTADPPQRPTELVELPTQIRLLASEVRNFAPTTSLPDPVPVELADYALPGYAFSILDLTERHSRLYRLPGYTVAVQLASLLLMPRGWVDENVQHIRKWAKTELANLSEPSAKPAPRKKS